MATTPPPISVVIPTYNRLPQLKRTLDGLAGQVGLGEPLEVVVVSDGATDHTDEWLRSSSVPLPLIAISQPNTGPAAARNRGVDEATGDIVLFVDDDVIPAPDLVAVHLRHHSPDDELVVIGPMNTPDEADMLPWVRWEQRKLAEQYEAMQRGDWEPTPRQFYTANASLARRHIIAAGGFDPCFRRAEDVELAYRLADRGLRFVFVPEASVVHDAERSFDAWRANARAYGRNDVIIGRDQGRRWLLDTITAEFHLRHPLVRALTRLSLRHERVRRALISIVAQTTRFASRIGPTTVAEASLSALYNLEYYQAMADEYGDSLALLARLDAAVQNP